VSGVKVERRIAHLVVFSEDTVADALAKLGRNQRRVLFCVDEAGVLEGVLTDGDVRRWLLQVDPIDLQRPVLEAANPDFTWVPAGATGEEIAAAFSGRVQQVPLLDDRGRLVAVADRDDAPFRVGDRTIGPDHPVWVIAEIGINHNGSVELGRELVEAAASAGADAVKFQMRDLATLYRDGGRLDAPDEDLGSQYVLDLLARFELDPDDLCSLFDHAASLGVTPFCTAWDVASVQRLDDYGIPAFKVASADLTNHELLGAMAATGRPMVVSTGMSSESEIVDCVAALRAAGASFALLHCNSTYPAPYRDLNLSYIQRLGELGGCPVGYSGHERGHHVAVAAVAVGARIIEKHFTLDRNLEGNDHKVSLLPDEFARMVAEIRDVDASLGSDAERSLTQGELMNRVTLAKSLVAVRDLRSGEVVGADDVTVKGPGRGLQPDRRDDLVGTQLRRDVSAGDFFFASDLSGEAAAPRAYRFRRPWGVPVRYHDVRAILAAASPEFVEFHLSYKDLDLDPAEFLADLPPCRFAVHSPDLFAGDHILNLATADPAHRRRTLDELRRTVDVAARIGEFFTGPERPVLVTSMGGFTSDRPVPIDERPAMYERVAAALEQVDTSPVEILAQTLPPFPWYLGGQLYCNLFVDAEDTAAFSASTGVPLCLDVSHTKLAANHRGASFSEWIDLLAPRARHLHVVDAAGVDGEGLQVGDGEVDFAVLGAQLDRWCPEAGFIPEIWQGHRNGGEGFWIALDRLEGWL
jgi:N-acetylneuraminate synthase